MAEGDQRCRASPVDARRREGWLQRYPQARVRVRRPMASPPWHPADCMREIRPKQRAVLCCARRPAGLAYEAAASSTHGTGSPSASRQFPHGAAEGVARWRRRRGSWHRLHPQRQRLWPYGRDRSSAVMDCPPGRQSRHELQVGDRDTSGGCSGDYCPPTRGGPPSCRRDLSSILSAVRTFACRLSETRIRRRPARELPERLRVVAGRKSAR